MFLVIIGIVFIAAIWITVFYHVIVGWSYAFKETNPFIIKHKKIEKGRSKVKSINDSILEADRKKAIEYQEYIKWCQEKGKTPNQEHPVNGKLKMMHAS